jgi:DNA-cytosine methyltransferase
LSISFIEDEGLNTLSLFDGMSAGRIALERAGIKVNKYYASEITKSKIKASRNYFPDNIYIGDVTKVSGHDYDVGILIGGSPCQGFSIMGDRLNFNDPRSGLIMDYFRILEELREKNPDVYFLLENVPMDKQAEIEISRRLGVLPVKINSSLVSAQNRKRLYWTNIPGTGSDLFGDEIEQPKDKGILLRDILQPESEVDEKYYLKDKCYEYVKKRILENEKFCNLNPEKSRAVQERYNESWNGTYISGELFNIYESGGAAGRVYNTNNKSVTLKAEGGGGGAKTGLYLISDQFINKNQNGIEFKIDPEKSYTLNTVDRQSLVIDLDKYRVRKLTPTECCRLQTVPDNYFNNSGLSDNQIYSCLGDGWTVDIIVHIFKGLKKCFTL